MTSVQPNRFPTLTIDTSHVHLHSTSSNNQADPLTPNTSPTPNSPIPPDDTTKNRPVPSEKKDPLSSEDNSPLLSPKLSSNPDRYDSEPPTPGNSPKPKKRSKPIFSSSSSSSSSFSSFSSSSSSSTDKNELPDLLSSLNLHDNANSTPADTIKGILRMLHTTFSTIPNLLLSCFPKNPFIYPLFVKDMRLADLFIQSVLRMNEIAKDPCIEEDRLTQEDCCLPEDYLYEKIHDLEANQSNSRDPKNIEFIDSLYLKILENGCEVRQICAKKISDLFNRALLTKQIIAAEKLFEYIDKKNMAITFDSLRFLETIKIACNLWSDNRNEIPTPELVINTRLLSLGSPSGTCFQLLSALKAKRDNLLAIEDKEKRIALVIHQLNTSLKKAYSSKKFENTRGNIDDLLKLSTYIAQMDLAEIDLDTTIISRKKVLTPSETGLPYTIQYDLNKQLLFIHARPEYSVISVTDGIKNYTSAIKISLIDYEDWDICTHISFQMDDFKLLEKKFDFMGRLSQMNPNSFVRCYTRARYTINTMGNVSKTYLSVLFESFEPVSTFLQSEKCSDMHRYIFIGDLIQGITDLHRKDIIHGSVSIDNMVVVHNKDGTYGKLMIDFDRLYSIKNNQFFRYDGTPIDSSPSVYGAYGYLGPEQLFKNKPQVYDHFEAEKIAVIMIAAELLQKKEPWMDLLSEIKFAPPSSPEEIQKLQVSFQEKIIEFAKLQKAVQDQLGTSEDAPQDFITNYYRNSFHGRCLSDDMRGAKSKQYKWSLQHVHELLIVDLLLYNSFVYILISNDSNPKLDPKFDPSLGACVMGNEVGFLKYARKRLKIINSNYYD